MRNRSACGPVGSAVTISPVPMRMSIERTDSCGSPFRKLLASIPRPVTAPPTVMVRNCGTTSGMTPAARVASTTLS